MFKYMWEHHSDKKWFIKADDDTYLHFENIVDMLSAHDHRDALYIGRAGEWGGGASYVKYCGGGAGYILSQKALEQWHSKINSCERLAVGEDVSVGKCLRYIVIHKNVILILFRSDKAGVTPIFKTGFYHKLPQYFLRTDVGRRDHPEGLTIRPLSFHSVQPDQMYEVDYLCHTINTNLPSSGKWVDPWPPSRPTH